MEQFNEMLLYLTELQHLLMIPNQYFFALMRKEGGCVEVGLNFDQSSLRTFLTQIFLKFNPTLSTLQGFIEKYKLLQLGSQICQILSIKFKTTACLYIPSLTPSSKPSTPRCCPQPTTPFPKTFTFVYFDWLFGDVRM